MAALTGKGARIRFTAATNTLSTNEACTLSTDGVTVTITDTTKRYWDRSLSTMPKIYSSASTGTAITDDYTVDHLNGTLTFATAHSTALTYTLDVRRFTSSFLAAAQSWDLTVDVATHDVTTFSTSGTDTAWRTIKPGAQGATVNIRRIALSTSTGGASVGTALFYDRLNTGTDLVVQLIPSNGLGLFHGYAHVESDAHAVDLDGLADQNVTLRVDGQLAYTTTTQ